MQIVYLGKWYQEWEQKTGKFLFHSVLITALTIWGPSPTGSGWRDDRKGLRTACSQDALTPVHHCLRAAHWGVILWPFKARQAFESFGGFCPRAWSKTMCDVAEGIPSTELTKPDVSEMIRRWKWTEGVRECPRDGGVRVTSALTQQKPSPVTHRVWWLAWAAGESTGPSSSGRWNSPRNRSSISEWHLANNFTKWVG